MLVRYSFASSSSIPRITRKPNGNSMLRGRPEHAVIVAWGWGELCQRRRIGTAPRTCVRGGFAGLRGKAHEHTALLSDRNKALAAARALESVAAGVEDEVMRGGRWAWCAKRRRGDSRALNRLLQFAMWQTRSRSTGERQRSTKQRRTHKLSPQGLLNCLA